MNYFVLVNPAAGAGKAGRLAPRILDGLRHADLTLEVAVSRRPHHATELVHQAYEAGHRRFLAVGGDGTAFEVINGLFPRASSGDPVVLGMIPLGTGNSFLRDFGIANADDSVAAIHRGNERRVDIVRATHQDGTLHYLNLLSLGFPADVATLTNAKFKRLGTAGYVAAVISKVASLRPIIVPVRCDGGEWDRRPCTFLSFSNSRFTAGGMMMAPNADVSDGALDVVRVDAVSRPTLLRAFPSIFRGSHLQRPDVSSCRATVVDLDVPPQDVMVDGEVVRLQLSRLEVLPGALAVLA